MSAVTGVPPGDETDDIIERHERLIAREKEMQVGPSYCLRIAICCQRAVGLWVAYFPVPEGLGCILTL